MGPSVIVDLRRKLRNRIAETITEVYQFEPHIAKLDGCNVCRVGTSILITVDEDSGTRVMFQGSREIAEAYLLDYLAGPTAA
jgi:hypothetical protein